MQGQLEREMPVEAWLADQAGDDELPAVIPDWVLEETPLAVLVDRFAEWGCGCDCGRVGCAAAACDVAPVLRPGLDRPATLEDLDPEGAEAAALSLPPAAPVSPEVLALQAAVEAACALDPKALGEDRALGDAEAVLECSRQLRVSVLDRIADVSDRSLHELTGHSSPRGWLMGVQPDADPTDVRFAEQSRHFGFLRQAISGGLVPIAAGKKVTQTLRRCGPWVDRRDGLIAGQPAEQVIAGVVRNVPVLIAETQMGFAPGDHRFEGLVLLCEAILSDGAVPDGPGRGELVQLERAFTLLAELVPVERLSNLLNRLFLALVPAELERQAAEAEANRRLDLNQRPDGMWQVRGLLTPECGEFVWTGLNAMLRRDPDSPTDTATAQALRGQGLDPYQPLPAEADAEGLVLPRNRGEKLHDALLNLCSTFLDKGLGGTHHKVPVGIVVTVTEPSATAQPGALPAMGDSGQPIARSLLRRWWCDSSITAFILARGGRALRSIHTGRTLTASERRARLIEQGGQCAMLSCRGHTRGHPGPLRPHHIRRFADDGTTSLEVTIMICDSCHRDLHDGGKTLRLRNGQLVNEQGWATHPRRPGEPPPF